MSLQTIKGGNIMGEDIINREMKDKKQKGITWSRIANKEAVKIMILLHDGGKATLDEISEKRQKNNPFKAKRTNVLWFNQQKRQKIYTK
jgi:hypothetical protein